MPDHRVFSQEMYRAAQSPVGWLLSAERLRDAAEAILQHEVQYEVSYFRAYDAAVKEAQAIAFAEGNDCGSAQISARAPNYPPAQLLYAYAIENVLKGIIVANNPRLIGGEKLNNALKSHDLFELAKDATVTVHVQEEPVMKALSQLSIWAGRYPVALHRASTWRAEFRRIARLRLSQSGHAFVLRPDV